MHGRIDAVDKPVDIEEAGEEVGQFGSERDVFEPYDERKPEEEIDDVRRLEACDTAQKVSLELHLAAALDVLFRKGQTQHKSTDREEDGDPAVHMEDGRDAARYGCAEKTAHLRHHAEVVEDDDSDGDETQPIDLRDVAPARCHPPEGEPNLLLVHCGVVLKIGAGRRLAPAALLVVSARGTFDLYLTVQPVPDASGE